MWVRVDAAVYTASGTVERGAGVALDPAQVHVDVGVGDVFEVDGSAALVTKPAQRGHGNTSMML